MQEKSTTGLQNILNNMEPSQLPQYLENYGHHTSKQDIFSEYIAEHPEMTVADIVRNSQGFLSQSYAYDILSGKKDHPSRDILLILCISAHMDRKMVRRVLEIYEHRDLYAKDKRDIIIATYINNKDYDLDKINLRLAEYNLELF